MARIYISYSNKDKDLVHQYVNILKEDGHEIFMDDTLIEAGKNIQKSLIEAMKKADGTIVFLTKNGIESKHVNSEIGMARSFLDNNGKFLIPLVEGSINVPFVIQDLMHLQIEKSRITEIVAKINDAIIKFVNVHYKKGKDRNANIGNSNKVRIEITHSTFTESLFDYLIELSLHSKIENWEYLGQTKEAYGTPVGPWETNGFLFKSKNYSFILRSIAGSENNKNASYIVIESNNLKSQLANLALYNSDKFVKISGQVFLFETYDMTVGLGRRSRDDVRSAFEKAGMKDHTITSFNEGGFLWDDIILDILKWAVYREEAKKILQSSTKIDNESISKENSKGEKFWFLKIYGDNWNLSSINEGDEGHFNSHFNSYEARPDYQLFKAVRKGDKGFAYDYSSKKSILFLFDVTKPLHYDKNREEIFSFVVSKILTKGIALSLFAPQISFSEEIGKDSVRKLFLLTRVEYDRLSELVGNNSISELVEPFFSRPVISKVFADSPSKDVKDELGFESDVSALASVIAYRDVIPPLAIGLFGNWGTGKSFFMNKLQQKIEDLERDPTGIFCKKVLQINFNSWHYSDSNLWASLITKIFEDLEVYGKNRPDELIELFKNLNSTKELLLEAKNEKDRVDNEIALLKTQKIIFDADVEKQVRELRSLSVKEILADLMKDTSVQGDFEKLKREYSFLNLKEYDDIADSVRKLDDFREKGIQSLKLFFSFMKGKTIFVLIFAALIAVGVFALYENSGIFKKYLGDYNAFFFMISGALGFFLKFLQPAIKVVNDAFKRLQSINHTVAKLREKANNKFTTEREELNKKLADAQVSSVGINKKIDLLEVEQKKLQNDIDDIASGRKLIRFIESRVTDERYINSLGIISWVRKDFEQLDKLLYQQKIAKKNIDQGANPIATAFELERIILYIDDLDRCSESIVVKVLEAIHLLLAFPLFVVVVGVDPRWMHKALNVQYSKLLSSPKGLINENGPLTETESGHPATSYDYLEKIFQIPFSLKTMNDVGKNQLIQAQLETKGTIYNVSVVEKANAVDNVSASDLIDDSSNPSLSKIVEEKAEENSPDFDKEKDEPEIINPETLRVSDEEIQFIKEISFLIGDSPRTIKRYINIYRIIRTHSAFETDSKEQLDYYLAAIILLSIITGLPKDVINFFGSVSRAESTATFSEFIEDYVSKFPEVDSKLSTLSIKLKINDFKLPMKGSGLLISHFQKNINLISRFSFRNIA